MTTQSTTARTHEAAPHPRSRLRARIVLACFAAVGLAALAWAAFVSPLPRSVTPPSATCRPTMRSNAAPRASLRPSTAI